MGKPYQAELAYFDTTYDWAMSADITTLSSAVQRANHHYLMAVGSGGSLSAAEFLCQLHYQYTGFPAQSVTPMGLEGFKSINIPQSIWLLSAGGNNHDIHQALHLAASQEPEQLVTLCGKEDSKLSRIAGQYNYSEVIEQVGPVQQDGFLATNSLLGFSTVLYRAYAQIWKKFPPLPASLEELCPPIKNENNILYTPNINTLIILYGFYGKISAIDLESKGTEAALAHIQYADFRNFAHGRHHWLAKHTSSSVVIVLSTPLDEGLAEKTVSLLPKEIPVIRLTSPYSDFRAELDFLVQIMWLVGRLGQIRGIDPGRPGVPEFGTRLYELDAWKPRQAEASQGLSSIQVSAIKRKYGTTAFSENFDILQQCIKDIQQKMTLTKFTGVVFDYDGTLVDQAHRYSPPSDNITLELTRLLENRLPVGIATGRGDSVGNDLRKVLPQKLWRQVIIGYHNGAIITNLADLNDPDTGETQDVDLEAFYKTLSCHPFILAIAKSKLHPQQISLQPKPGYLLDHLWNVLKEYADKYPTLSLFCSDHSVDVLAGRGSKKAVLTAMRSLLKYDNAPILTIGDKGAWPGNDYELLSEPLSLSVDTVSSHPDRCWNFAPPGLRGTAATLHYLRHLHIDNTVTPPVVAVAKGMFGL